MAYSILDRKRIQNSDPQINCRKIESSTALSLVRNQLQGDSPSSTIQLIYYHIFICSPLAKVGQKLGIKAYNLIFKKAVKVGMQPFIFFKRKVSEFSIF